MSSTPTLEQFLAGQPLAFKSLAGHDRVATFHTDEVSWMEFTYPTGKVLMRPIMSRDEAERFYLDATSASQECAVCSARFAPETVASWQPPVCK